MNCDYSSSTEICVKSSITKSQSGVRASRLLVVARPMTLAPEARPAVMPWKESSKTMVSCGVAPSASMPLRKHSGSGFDLEKCSLVSTVSTRSRSSG